MPTPLVPTPDNPCRPDRGNLYLVRNGMQPVLVYKNHIISTIYPFTIDNYLINKVKLKKIPTSSGYRWRLTFHYNDLYKRKRVNFSTEETEEIFNLLNNILSGCQERNNVPVHSEVPTDSKCWIKKIKEQCNYLRFASEEKSISNYLSCIVRLKGMNMGDNYFVDIQDSMSEFGKKIIKRIRHIIYNIVCRQLYRERGLSYGFGINDNCFQNDESFLPEYQTRYVPVQTLSTNRELNYIHSYNYVPEYIKHPDPNSSLLLGIEIEVAGNKNPKEKYNRNKVVKKCIQIMNDSESDKEDIIYSTSDSTVQIEFDIMPCGLNFHKQLNYRKMFDYLSAIGYRGHDCKNAGLHVHVNRDYLGSTKTIQQLTIVKILYLLEKFNEEICVIARRKSTYSKFIGEKDDSVIEIYNKYMQQGKQVALNLQHKDTIEFRCFRSTLKYETFILTLEFVKSIVDFAKQTNVENIESTTWTDLMRSFPKAVSDYYIERKRKENNDDLCYWRYA